MKITVLNLKPVFLGILLICQLLSACGATIPTPTATATKETVADSATATNKWDWFNIELTDVQTGETFTMNDFSGKVVLVETMAIWCPNCIVQGNEVRKLHTLLGNPEDLISVSLDVDMNEDEASLKEYAQEFGFEWHFAVAPLEVARALGNLYSAQYLNPPLSPMLVIDRDGSVYQFEYGKKSVEILQKNIQPFLTP